MACVILVPFVADPSFCPRSEVPSLGLEQGPACSRVAPVCALPSRPAAALWNRRLPERNRPCGGRLSAGKTPPIYRASAWHLDNDPDRATRTVNTGSAAQIARAGGTHSPAPGSIGPPRVRARNRDNRRGYDDCFLWRTLLGVPLRERIRRRNAVRSAPTRLIGTAFPGSGRQGKE